MLRNTFMHLPHIGPGTEKRLWQNGVLTWEDILLDKNEFARKFSKIKHLLKLSEHKLKIRDVRFFTDRLVADQHWRIFPDFRAETAYLDIETTGLSPTSSYITTISVYDSNSNRIRYYIRGRNLAQFITDIKKYRVIVTYNGKCFDVPFIEQEFGIYLPQAHLDLRYILHSIGLKGGLKRCEQQLGLVRGTLEGIDGYFAVLLWNDYLAGNKKALETLLAYNIEDTINLEILLHYALNRKLQELPIDTGLLGLEFLALKPMRRISSPFAPDLKTIHRIMRNNITERFTK